MSRPTFTSRLSATLSIIGVAVGLGNVWRFPYMMGKFGGSAFLFIYIFFVLLFAIPALSGELALGRHTGRGPVGAFGKTLGPVLGKGLAWLISTALLVANAYYIVVIANIVNLTFYSGAYGFDDKSHHREGILNNGLLQFLVATIVLVLVGLVVSRGLKKGIEQVSRIIVPFFGLVMIFLLFHVLNLPDALNKLWAFLSPDFSQLTISTIFAALGQAFFSLTLGGTVLVVYGSYLKKEEKLFKIALFSGLGDLSASLLVALILVPAILVYGINLNEGHTLLFVTLPILFEQMPAGRILGSFFLLALTLIAFLSSMASVQYLSSTIELNTRLSFKRSVVLVILLDFLLIIPCAFFGDIIPVLDLIFGSGMQVLGSCLAIIALTWFLGRKITQIQIFGEKPTRFHKVFYFWLRWIIPAALIITLGLYIYQNLFL